MPATEPEAVLVEASSVREAVWSEPAEVASLAPVMVMVTVSVSEPLFESVPVTVNASVTESLASSAVVSESELDRV